ncbi:MAG TPA: type II CAAX endopeptidase family protein [Anaerohalosphaeraceae bacterium]|nr:type II CAAX endopeptidase family protein [Anaerohalosphaeraceae bacterium]
MPSGTGGQFIGWLAAAQETAPASSALRTLSLLWWTFCALGGLLTIQWMVSLRRGNPLTRCPVRRHRLPTWFVPLQLFVWMLGSFLILSVIKTLVPPQKKVLLEAALHGSTILWYLHLTVLFLAVAHFGFVRGLVGFGLDFRRLKKDLLNAAGILWGLLPLIVLALEGTSQIGRFLFGPDFTMDRHTSLSALQEYPQLWLRLLIVVNAVLVVPVFEEVLFRGLLQSVLTAALGKPWVSILAVSALFAGMHPYPTHIAALLILSIGLGYAYEKSGSLWQPIFIHILFNSINVAAALLGV